MWNKKHGHVGPPLSETEASASAVLAAEPGSGEETRRVNEEIRSGAGLEAFFEALLPMLGVMPSTVKEFPGLFRIEAGPGDDEATVHIDMAARRCAPGEKPLLERVVTLSVRLDHDYRLLGSGYYCIDCDLPENDTLH